MLQAIKELWLNRSRLPYEEQQVYVAEPVVTEREREVIRLMAHDLRVKEIAFKLGISEKTVDFHRQRINTRIGVSGSAGILRYAIRNGILEA